MANAFKSGASQSRSTNDFNERAKQLSERLGAIEKPNHPKRANAPRRSFKSGPRPEAEPQAEPVEDKAEGDAAEGDAAEMGKDDGEESLKADDAED